MKIFFPHNRAMNLNRVVEEYNEAARVVSFLDEERRKDDDRYRQRSRSRSRSPSPQCRRRSRSRSRDRGWVVLDRLLHTAKATRQEKAIAFFKYLDQSMPRMDVVQVLVDVHESVNETRDYNDTNQTNQMLLEHFLK